MSWPRRGSPSSSSTPARRPAASRCFGGWCAAAGSMWCTPPSRPQTSSPAWPRPLHVRPLLSSRSAAPAISARGLRGCSTALCGHWPTRTSRTLTRWRPSCSEPTRWTLTASPWSETASTARCSPRNPAESAGRMRPCGSVGWARWSRRRASTRPSQRSRASWPARAEPSWCWPALAPSATGWRSWPARCPCASRASYPHHPRWPRSCAASTWRSSPRGTRRCRTPSWRHARAACRSLPATCRAWRTWSTTA